MSTRQAVINYISKIAPIHKKKEDFNNADWNTYESHKQAIKGLLDFDGEHWIWAIKKLTERLGV